MIVRKLRLQKGLSQQLLAEMAGISSRTLQRIERGASANPETFKSLGAVLEVDFSVLRDNNRVVPIESASEQYRNGNMNGESESVHHLEQKQDSKLKERVMNNQERDAMIYVRDIKGFYVHVVHYFLAIVCMLIGNLLTSPDNLWVIWPALGWGMGVLAHGSAVFELFDGWIFTSNWEKKQIERRLNREVSDPQLKS